MCVLDERLGDSKDFTEDMIWDTASQVASQLRLRARSEVMVSMRHALTGRTV